MDKLTQNLNLKKIKNIRLSVSAPFHCELMQKATKIVTDEIKNVTIKDSKKKLVSNVTANEISNSTDLQKLLVSQIENKVRWRESIQYLIKNGVNNFIEIGPGKVLSGLIKRIDKSIKISAINNEKDINSIILND